MDARLERYLSSIGIDSTFLDDWTIDVARRNDEDVAIVATLGCEIHILPIVEKRALSRKNIRAYLHPILEKFGYATTRVPLNIEDNRLRTRLGFMPTWQDEQFQYWALTSMPYEKE